MDHVVVHMTVLGRDWPDVLERAKAELQSFYPDQSWDLTVEASSRVEGAGEVVLWQADITATPQAPFKVVVDEPYLAR